MLGTVDWPASDSALIDTLVLCSNIPMPDTPIEAVVVAVEVEVQDKLLVVD